MIFYTIQKYLRESGLPPVPVPEDKVYTLEEAHEFYRIQFEHLSKFIEYMTSEENSRMYDMVSRDSTVCPKCKSTKVNDRIKRTQGSGYGSMGGSAFGMYGSYHSEIDTKEVNKCGDCGHEWKKMEYHYTSSYEVLKDLLFSPTYYYERLVREDRDDDDEVKVGWLAKTNKKEREMKKWEDYIKSMKDEISLMGYCKEVIKAYFLQERKTYHSEWEAERFDLFFDADDEHWSLWGGSVIDIEKLPMYKKILNKILFWRN